jgi:ArsR family transcriptional regulator
MEAHQTNADQGLSATELFRLLGDETRLRTVILLNRRGELCVCELTETLGVSQPKMSRHLATLRDSGLVETRRSGQWIHYRLRRDRPEWLRAAVDAICASLADRAPHSDDARKVTRAIARNRSECES